ncbi:hypothetical protein GCM10009641_15910 [Mycobacterium cookii]|uniref:Uncharacterized protein n=1 Tax=Mycobacterium cookii TaxID=1775 RepID=A0A7I7KZS9_9MYCO|nr:hypothetical protein [Mycobacterium cookii]MCV7330420.1 hypothetical protein [Mycobacterium cookii]BBX47393.1 hypothetical protein MCOO_34080 [Mycobacterium cookii]
MADPKGHKTESSVHDDTDMAWSRKGRDQDGSYVGRTIGTDDALDVGETGAEARRIDSSKDE